MWFPRLVLFGVSAVSVACTSATSPSCTSNCVTIQDFSFAPSTMTIKVGTRVTWTDAGPSAHTATSDGGVWDSGTLGAPSGGGGYGGGTAGGPISSPSTPQVRTAITASSTHRRVTPDLREQSP